jgi:hypothetical protein
VAQESEGSKLWFDWCAWLEGEDLDSPQHRIGGGYLQGAVVDRIRDGQETTLKRGKSPGHIAADFDATTQPICNSCLFAGFVVLNLWYSLVCAYVSWFHLRDDRTHNTS